MPTDTIKLKFLSKMVEATETALSEIYGLKTDKSKLISEREILQSKVINAKFEDNRPPTFR
jgi:hypothetical protein